MMALLTLLAIPLLALAGRTHGGLGWIPKGRILSTLAFGGAFGWACYSVTGLWWLALLGAIVTMEGIATGHGNFYAMTGANDSPASEPEMIERALRPLYVRLGGDIKKPVYSWVMMGAKGFLIGLAAFPYGIPLAVLWPAAYWLSFRKTQDSALAEWLTGAMAGAVISLAVL